MFDQGLDQHKNYHSRSKKEIITKISLENEYSVFNDPAVLKRMGNFASKLGEIIADSNFMLPKKKKSRARPRKIIAKPSTPSTSMSDIARTQTESFVSRPMADIPQIMRIPIQIPYPMFQPYVIQLPQPMFLNAPAQSKVPEQSESESQESIEQPKTKKKTRLRVYLLAVYFSVWVPKLAGRISELRRKHVQNKMLQEQNTFEGMLNLTEMIDVHSIKISNSGQPNATVSRKQSKKKTRKQDQIQASLKTEQLLTIVEIFLQNFHSLILTESETLKEFDIWAVTLCDRSFVADEAYFMEETLLCSVDPAKGSLILTEEQQICLLLTRVFSRILIEEFLMRISTNEDYSNNLKEEYNLQQGEMVQIFAMCKTIGYTLLMAYDEFIQDFIARSGAECKLWQYCRQHQVELLTNRIIDSAKVYDELSTNVDPDEFREFKEIYGSINEFKKRVPVIQQQMFDICKEIRARVLAKKRQHYAEMKQQALAQRASKKKISNKISSKGYSLQSISSKGTFARRSSENLKSLAAGPVKKTSSQRQLEIRNKFANILNRH